MRRSVNRGMIAAVGMVAAFFFISCASVTKPSGFLDGYYKKLKPGPEGGANLRWVKPGVDFSKYNKVKLDSVVFYFSKDSEDKGIDPEQMKDLSDDFNKEIVKALKDRYPIVAQPGTDVVHIKIALTGIKQSSPVLSGVTTVVPVGLAVSVIKKTSVDSWTGSGATGMEMMALDSESNDVLVAVQDEQTAGFTERFSKYGSANEAFKFWAERIRKFMDEAHGDKKQ